MNDRKGNGADGMMAEENEAGLKEMRNCRLCPRNCGIDRNQRSGSCRVGAKPRVARAALHMWEEPCISGEEGSGAVFFTGCNLGCVYCQNREIADGTVGKEVSVERLAEIYLELQEQKANNINLVTAGHWLSDVIASVKLARRRGLRIPVVYNSSGYEKVQAIRQLKDVVDIFLPDLKYLSRDLAKRYSHAADYPDVAAAALEAMVSLAGEPQFDGREMMTRGVIVRHLILPGHLEESKAVIRYLYETYGDRIYISIMNQYTPMPGIEARFPELGRTLTEQEYDEVVDYAIDLGVENGFIQEGETAKESFIPAFDITGV